MIHRRAIPIISECTYSSLHSCIASLFSTEVRKKQNRLAQKRLDYICYHDLAELVDGINYDYESKELAGDTKKFTFGTKRIPEICRLTTLIFMVFM